MILNNTGFPSSPLIYEFWDGIQSVYKASGSTKVLRTLTGSVDEIGLIRMEGLQSKNIFNVSDNSSTAYQASENGVDGNTYVVPFCDISKDFTRDVSVFQIDLGVSGEDVIRAVSELLVKSSSNSAVFHLSTPQYQTDRSVEQDILALKVSDGQNDARSFAKNFVQLFHPIKAHWIAQNQIQTFGDRIFANWEDVPVNLIGDLSDVKVSDASKWSDIFISASHLVKLMYNSHCACIVTGMYIENDGVKCRFHYTGQIKRVIGGGNSKTVQEKIKEYLTKGSVAPRLKYYRKSNENNSSI